MVPPGTYGRVAPRSGLGKCQPARLFSFPSLTEHGSPASKFSIDTGAGVIDADYRGILHILLFNLGDDDFEGSSPSLCLRHLLGPFTCFLSVAEGDRIAQLIVERIYTPDVREVEVGPLFSCSGPLSNPSLGLGRDCTW